MVQEQIITNRLKAAIEEDKVVLFAGAGTSVSLGLPTWQGLVLKILKELGKDTNVYCPFESLIDAGTLSPLFVLNHLKEQHKMLIIETLERELKLNNDRKFSLHKKLLQLSRKIITSNYDRAFEMSGPDIDVVLNDAKYKLASIADRTNYLFKIHGDFNSLENCLLFEEQYQNLYKDNAFMLGLRILFVQQTVLFIGCSLTDPYIENIIISLNEMFGSLNKEHYIITTDKSFPEAKFNYKVKKILVSDYDKGLEQLLDTLIKYKMRGPVLESVTSVHNLKRRKYKSFIDRRHHVQNILRNLTETANVVCIVGLQGIGKSSLALEVAYSCIGRPEEKLSGIIQFQFVIWVSARDFVSGDDNLNRIFDEISRITGYIKITQMLETRRAEKEREVNRLLSENRILIIIDGFDGRSEPDIQRWLATISGSSRVILTATEEFSCCQNCYYLNGLSEEESYDFIRAEAEAQGIQLGQFDTIENLKKLFTITNGSPQGLVLSLGLIHKRAFSLSTAMSVNEVSIYRQLYAQSWQNLTPNARKILSYFTVLSSDFAIERRVLLYMSEMDPPLFNNVMIELCGWNLLFFGLADEKYTIQPTLIRFITEQVVHIDTEKIKKRFIEFVLVHIAPTIVRAIPTDPYWNVLVSEKMNFIERDWPSIYQAFVWACEIPSAANDLINLVLYFVHYLDSRFYNQERLRFVQEAIAICERSEKKYLSALLKIDALGWTFVEEFALDKADASIQSGLAEIESLNTEEAGDLKALGIAWLSRVCIEQKNAEKALELIRRVLSYSGKYHIQFRIFMAAGDIHFKLDEFELALKYYQKAQAASDRYGGEGHDYQIKPRLGLAHLSLNEMEEAKRMFTDVKSYPEIFIGELYGEYGLALISYKEGSVADAQLELARVETEIHKRSNSNLLLKLIEQYKRKIR